MKTSISTEIKYSDIDDNGQMSFGNIIDYFQNISNMQSESLGVGVKYMQDRKRAWILSSWEIKIKKLPFYMDKIVVSTWPYAFKGVCGRRNYSMALEGEKENIVEADTVWALLNTEKNMLSRLTDEDTRAYECEEKLDMEYSAKKIVRAENYERCEEFKVRKYHLDTNNHMNNGWYVKLAEEFVEDKRNVYSIRVEYKKSALYNDIIVPYVAYESKVNSDNEVNKKKRIVVELRNIDEEIFAIIEFGLV